MRELPPPHCWLLFPLVAVLLANPVPTLATPPDAPEIEQLIQQLGNPKFAEREAATKRLSAIGEPALEALKKATENTDAEVRRRAGDIVAGIEKKLYGETATFEGHEDEVTGIAFSPDGKRIVSSSGDGTLRLWDVEKVKEIRVLKGHKEMVSGVAWARDGKAVVSVGG